MAKLMKTRGRKFLDAGHLIVSYFGPKSFQDDTRFMLTTGDHRVLLTLEEIDKIVEARHKAERDFPGHFVHTDASERNKNDH